MSSIRVGVWAAVAVILVSVAGAQSYTITDLGVLPGSDETLPTAINDYGDVVGDAYVNGEFHAFLWTPAGGIQDLGTFGADTESYGAGINDSGTVVGLSEGNSGKHAFLWTRAGGMQDLGNLGGANGASANAINNSGSVVGGSFLSDNVSTHPFLWTKTGGMVDLGTLGGEYGSAYAINSAGEIVGTTTLSGSPVVYRAFSWTKSGGMQNLGALQPSQWSIATGINVSGRVVGYCESANQSHSTAFALSPGSSMQSLGAGNESVAVGISGSEIVGGYEATFNAFLWTPTQHLQNLNDLIPPDSGWFLIEADAVNRSGQIAVEGMFNGEFRAALLTPTN